MRLTEVTYAAGFFDGEGCISISTQKRSRIRLIVQQNVREPLDFLQRLWGGSVYGPYTRRRSRDAPGVVSTPYFVWRLTDQEDVLYALTQMEPYFLVKGGQANEALLRMMG